MSKPIINLKGKRFGRLIVQNKRIVKKENVLWLCLCDCGKEQFVRLSHLSNGHTKSCGCLHLEIVSKVKHGMTGTPTFSSWANMINRCKNPKCDRWLCYGGRGISVCKRWLKFENFYKDMGVRPKGLTLDRINNDGNYTPSNCRWATNIQQANNKRRNKNERAVLETA